MFEIKNKARTYQINKIYLGVLKTLHNYSTRGDYKNKKTPQTNKKYIYNNLVQN